MQQLATLYHAIARRIVKVVPGKFKVTEFDSQEDTKAGLSPFHILVQFPGTVDFSSASGGFGGRYIRELTIRLWVKVTQGPKYLQQLSFLEQITNALHTWVPEYEGATLGLSGLYTASWEMDDRGPGQDFRIHQINIKTSGYARGSNLSELGEPIPDDLEVYVSVELAED